MVSETAGAIGSSRRIRVAFCIDNMNVGGTELNAVRLAERLDRSRVELRVICLQAEGPLLRRYAEAGIPVHPLPIRSLYGAGSARQGVRLMRLLRENRVDVLHAHDVYSNVFAVPWARLAGARTISSRRWWEGSSGLQWKVATHTANRVAHRVLANAPAIVPLLEREGVARERIAVVPNFLDEAAFDLLPDFELQRWLAELGGAPRGRRVGVVANLHPIKDHRSLLEAVALLGNRHPNIQLILVGDGSAREDLHRLAMDLGIAGRVLFGGRRPNLPNLHQLFEISVLTSVSEGFPNTVLEAMAAGRPVVATRVGAVSDAVVDGETGLLVPPRDPVRLAAALQALLDQPDRGRAMGERGRERARALFSAQTALSALEALYEELAGPRAKPARTPTPSLIRSGR